MAQLNGEVAYLHQACALCFAMRDNLAAAVVSALLCELMLHTRSLGSKLSLKGLVLCSACCPAGAIPCTCSATPLRLQHVFHTSGLCCVLAAGCVHSVSLRCTTTVTELVA